MNVVYIFNALILLSEIVIELLSIILSLTLFLEGRWSRKKTIAVFMALAFFPVGFLALTNIDLLRMCGTCLVAILILRMVFKDSIFKLLLIFCIYYIILVFSEAIVYFICHLLRPDLNIDTLLNANQVTIADKVMHLSRFRCYMVLVVIALTVVMIHMIYLFFRRRQLEIQGQEFRPFLLFGLLQLLFSFFITYFINTRIEDPIVFPLLIFLQTSMLGGLLWMVWQLHSTGKRIRVEEALIFCQERNDIDMEHYCEMKQIMLKTAKLRHDFYNQEQLIKFLLEQNDIKSIETARGLMKNLAEDLNKLHQNS